MCETAEEVVHFDRLCRTLHALNLLAQRRHVGGYLQMAVHPRHLLAVQNQHGLVYEAILKRCGLAPSDIVLEIDARHGSDNARLGEAVHSYRQRGYRLALGASAQDIDPVLLLALKPDILKRQLPEGAEIPDAAPHVGVAIEVSGIDSGQDFALARAAGFELGQGRLFGDARPECRATHADDRVAYNYPSFFVAVA